VLPPAETHEAHVGENDAGKPVFSLVALPKTQPTETDAAKTVFAYWCEKTGHTRAQWTPERGRTLKARLAEEPGSMLEKIAGLKLAVDGVLVDPWFNGSERAKLTGFMNVFLHQGRNRIEKLQDAARRGHEPQMDKSTRSSISALNAIGED